MYSEVMPIKSETFSGVAAKSPIGQCIRSVLRRALAEHRLTIGLMPTLQYLSKNCNGALFCFTTEACDRATHIQEVLLQAFCVEHDINIIKVDDVDKMRCLLGCNSMERRTDYTCILVHYPCIGGSRRDNEQPADTLTNAERDLASHCTSPYGIVANSVIKLPEK